MAFEGTKNVSGARDCLSLAYVSLTSKKHKQDYKQRGTTTWG